MPLDTSFRVPRRPGPGVRFHPCRRPWLSRHRRRHRGTRGAGQSFDLRSGGDRWLAGTTAGGGRPAAPGACLALCRGGLGAAAFAAGGGRRRGELAGGSRTLRPSPDPGAVERFFAETWTVGSEADRTGYRFKGRHGAPVRARANSHSAQARTRPTSSTPAIPSARSRYRAGSNPSSCIAMRCPVGICHAGHGDQPRPEPAGADAAEPEGAFRRRQPGGRSRGASPLQLASATTPALLPALSRRYRAASVCEAAPGGHL